METGEFGEQITSSQPARRLSIWTTWRNPFSYVTFEQPAGLVHGVEPGPLPMTARDFWQEMHKQRHLHLAAAIPFTITQEFRWEGEPDQQAA